MIRCSGILRVTLFISALFGATEAAAPCVEAADAPALRHRAEFPLDGIVGLKGDRFLLWFSSGEMQVGTAAGQWTPVFRAALHPVVDVAPDEQGILAAASVDMGMSGVVLLDTAGHEQARWTLKEQVFRVFAREHGRFVTTRAGIVPLLAGGAIGPVAPYADPATPFDTVPPGPLAAPPDVLRFASASNSTANPASIIACRARDLSKAHHAPGRCWKSGPAGWKILGDFARPMACGDWLFAVEETHATRIVAYSIASGKPEMKIATTSSPRIACASSGELLVGDRRLATFRPPEQTPTWTSPVMRAPIIDLAATETAIAYRLRGSLDVFIVPRR